VWNTDAALLSTIADLEERVNPAGRAHSTGLNELVERYRLMEPTHRVLEIFIEDEDALRILRRPSTVAWIENRLSSPALEPFLVVSSRRFAHQDESTLFQRSIYGVLGAFKLGAELHHRNLPEWLRARVPQELSGARLKNALSNVVRAEMPVWVRDKPWLSLTKRRRESLVESLKAIGNWSFRLSRNENIHAYPSTFVHAIPASLINSLGLRGELVLDPFGGTGQTALEAVKYECNAISADSSMIATLIAKARLTPLKPEEREWLSAISLFDLERADPGTAPEFDHREKWHHPKTLLELCRIRSFIRGISEIRLQPFLLACFSAIVPLCTARRGKEHGFFADNTPLPATLAAPPYVAANELFLGRVRKNLGILARLYSFIERSGRDPERELLRARVIQLDARSASPSEYGVSAGSVSAIITSPPYLCMADYSLGQRLSYYWIAPEELNADFDTEISPRRHRFRRESAAESYFYSIAQFARNASLLLRKGGFLATILGKPVAKPFVNVEVLERIDQIFADVGFDKLWEQTRPIHWHRNQGYQRLLTERVAVHLLR
jgi:hypothetical protein